MARVNKTHKNKQPSYLRFVAIPLSLTAIWVLVTFFSVQFGDRLLEKDRITQAHGFYKIASILNPFDTKINQRIEITKVIASERKGESEETAIAEDSQSQPIALQSNNNAAVLGISTTVPVLMYHYIRVNPNPKDVVGFNLSVTPDNFAAQMDYLVQHGYHSISLDELGATLLSGAKLPDKPFVITLDDGYRDSYSAAYPILKARGLKAVNFVITGFVGGPNYLTWDQINEMTSSGVFTFESHTVNHTALTSVAPQRISQELSDSKNVLQSHVGYLINWIAYPYGYVNQTVANLVPKAGYVGAFGTNRGTFQSTDAMFTLPRVRIGGGDSMPSFAAKLPWK